MSCVSFPDILAVSGRWNGLKTGNLDTFAGVEVPHSFD